MEWKKEVINNLKNASKVDKVWSNLVNTAIENSDTKIHLAIFSEPFLSLVLSGEKTIESRFSKHRIAPFEKIGTNDIIIVKETGGPCKGILLVGEVWFYKKENPNQLNNIKKKFAKQICSNHVENFWKKRVLSSYITLIEITQFLQLPSFKINKRDRNAWVIVK